MGQYYIVCNLDKREYLDPHACGDGAKLMEFSQNSYGMMRALAILLSQGNGRGVGDFRSTDPLIGSWAGDRIVVAGDYADEDDPIVYPHHRRSLFLYNERYRAAHIHKRDEDNIYAYAMREFTNISGRIQNVLREAGEEMIDAIGSR